MSCHARICIRNMLDLREYKKGCMGLNSSDTRCYNMNQNSYSLHPFLSAGDSCVMIVGLMHTTHINDLKVEYWVFNAGNVLI